MGGRRKHADGHAVIPIERITQAGSFAVTLPLWYSRPYGGTHLRPR